MNQFIKILKIGALKIHWKLEIGNWKFPQGFTLLEVVMVVALLIVVMTGAIAALGSFRKTIDLNTVAEEIASNLRRAQTRAMNADSLSRWGIHFANPASGDDFYSLYSGDTYTADVEKNFLPGAAVFTTPSASSTQYVLFEKLSGALVSGSATSTVMQTADGSRSKTITVNSVGRVSY